MTFFTNLLIQLVDLTNSGIKKVHNIVLCFYLFRQKARTKKKKKKKKTEQKQKLDFICEFLFTVLENVSVQLMSSALT